jgi:hypothetical protein
MRRGKKKEEGKVETKKRCRVLENIKNKKNNKISPTHHTCVGGENWVRHVTLED